MKTVRIGEGFHAYPNGKRRDFAVGAELSLANGFADLIIGKGLAVEIAADTSEPDDPETDAEEDEADAAESSGAGKTDPETA